jgi:Uma2 family endonuclease
MATKAKTKLTAEQFLKKYEGEDGRFELVEGEVIKMASETARHVRAKKRILIAFENAIRRNKLECEAFADGMTIKIDKWTAREPDLSVQCGKSIDDDALILDNPVVVVEVVSPTSEFRDVYRKQIEYLSVASIQHYLIVDQFKRVVLHNKRTGKDSFATKILGRGTIDLDPPGFRVAVVDLLGAA